MWPVRETRGHDHGPFDVTKARDVYGPGRESTGLALARTNPAWDQSGLAIWVICMGSG